MGPAANWQGLWKYPVERLSARVPSLSEARLALEHLHMGHWPFSPGVRHAARCGLALEVGHFGPQTYHFHASPAQAMSRLAVRADDHPCAAEKHLADAVALSSAGRFDGAAYLAGYVVECVLKAVILHDRSYDQSTGGTDAVALQQWHQQLRRRPYGHALLRLMQEIMGPAGAPYAPPIEETSSIISDWSENMRYRAEGASTKAQADAFVDWGQVAILSVLRMRIDGVL